MSRWALETKPAAVLEPQDYLPLDRGDGVRVMRWRTSTGVLHAQLIYPTGRIEWYQLVEA